MIFSFAKKGRGPGELLDATSLYVNDQDQIFVFDRMNSKRGYEISAYDFSGNLIRKIVKDYEPVPVTKEYKDTFMKLFDDPLFDRVRDQIRKNIYFPFSLPPFHSFISDDRGRLFVMTYEECENPDDHMFDIFSEDGTFMGKAEISLRIETEGLNAAIKKDRFYCLREKESGYMELVVYKMRWE